MHQDLELIFPKSQSQADDCPFANTSHTSLASLHDFLEYTMLN